MCAVATNPRVTSFRPVNGTFPPVPKTFLSNEHSEQKDVKMRAIAKLLSAARCNQTQPAGEVR